MADLFHIDTASAGTSRDTCRASAKLMGEHLVVFVERLKNIITYCAKQNHFFL
jgi:hypothetical protein